MSNPRVKISDQGRNKLEEIRQKSPLTDEKLFDDISEKTAKNKDSVSSTTVDRIFTQNNTRRFYKNNIIAVCKVLGLDPNEIIDNETPPPPPPSLWDQLTQEATPQDEMGVIPDTGKQQGLMDNYDNPYIGTLKAGTPVRFQMSLQNFSEDLHLLLLERDPKKEIFCLCPSSLVQQPVLKKGNIILPDDKAKKRYFTPKTPGKEEFLAITSCQPFVDLEWLPTPADKPKILNEEHLNKLLEYLEKFQCQLDFTEFEVIG